MHRKFETPTDEDAREIERQIAGDQDEAPMLTKEAATRATRFRGPQKTPKKEQVAIRLDADVLERLRADGRGWQTRTNDMLRRALGL